MQSDQTALSNGKPGAARQRAAARSDLDELRATCQRLASRRGANGRVEHGEAIEVRFALDVHAPAAARGVVADCLGARVAADVLDDAQLLMSELVTNSVRHSGATATEGVVVRVELNRRMLRIEVEDPGRDGVVAPRAADGQIGGGFGLNLVQALSERWGVERVAAGGTRVWAQLAHAAGRAGQ